MAALHERALRQHQGRPRGAARPRRDLHAGGAADDRPGRLAADRVPHARRHAVLRRHLLPAGRPPRHARLPARAATASPTRGRDRRDEVARAAARAARAAAGARRDCAGAGETLGAGRCSTRAVAGVCAQQFDAANGGFGSAPKFPHAMALEFLLRLAAARAATRAALHMVHAHAGRDGARAASTTSSAAASTATRRRALARAALREDAVRQRAAGACLPARLAAARATSGRGASASETLDWALREMRAPEGGFYSALDADSEGEEGRFYVWTSDQVRDLLGEERRACDPALGPRRRAEFRGPRNVLHVATDDIDPDCSSERAPSSTRRARSASGRVSTTSG